MTKRKKKLTILFLIDVFYNFQSFNTYTISNLNTENKKIIEFCVKEGFFYFRAFVY